MSAVAIAGGLVFAARVYLALGGVFAVVFVLFLVKRMDPAATGATWGFRLAIVPGVALLWPFLLSRVVLGRKTPVECNAHRDAALPADALVRTKRRP